MREELEKLFGVPITSESTKTHLDEALLNVLMCKQNLKIVLQFCKLYE